MTTVLVLATANPDKVAEIGEILAGALGDVIELRPRPTDLPEVVEDGRSLEENARLKAVAICEATGEAAVADDTGLEVDALGGAPGVFSARYAGPDATYTDNVTHLLAELDRVRSGDDDTGDDAPSRRARFRTVALLRRPDGSELVTEGVVQGVIAELPVGAGGFGYDPVFVPDEAVGRSFAQLSADEKNAISHRGRAFRALAAELSAGG